MALPTDYLWFWIFVAATVLIVLVAVMTPVYILLWSIREQIILAGEQIRETKNRNSN